MAGFVEIPLATLHQEIGRFDDFLKKFDGRCSKGLSKKIRGEMSNLRTIIKKQSNGVPKETATIRIRKSHMERIKNFKL